jgi:hypothetical protein
MVKAAELFAEDIATLRETIRANDGRNVATGAFARKVDQLIDDFYDDIDDLTALRLGDILDLFLIKVLYVNRQSRDAETMAYLGRMLERYLRASEMSLGRGGGFMAYMSDLMEETANPSGQYQNEFEAYRKWGDNALFIAGIFPKSLGRKRAGGILGGTPYVDRSYFTTVGRRYYEMAAKQELARWIEMHETLRRLSHFFDVYVAALNEMSDRYVMGIDMRIIADKMLDAFNRYRATRDERHLATARKYAALLKLDGTQWPALDKLSTDMEAPRYF